MTKPTHPREINLDDIIDPTPPADMHEDTLNKRMEQAESWVMAYLVLLQRGNIGLYVSPEVDAAIEYYGRLWDESWTR